MSIEKCLWAISMYGKNEQKGLVEIRIDNSRVQVTPEKAREFASTVFMAAEAAETDDFLMKFTEKIGVQEERDRAKLLHEFRQFREELRRKGESK